MKRYYQVYISNNKNGLNERIERLPNIDAPNKPSAVYLASVTNEAQNFRLVHGLESRIFVIPTMKGNKYD